MSPDRRILITTWLTALLCCFPLVSPAQTEVKAGDSRATVIKVLGKPVSVAKVGNTEILQYNAGTVELENDKVTIIDSQLNASAKDNAERQAFEADQKAKGLVEYEGQWVTPQRKASLEKSKARRAKGGGGGGGFAAFIAKITGAFSKSSKKSTGGGTAAGPAAGAIEVYKIYATFIAKGQYAEGAAYATGQEINRNKSIASTAVSQVKAATASTVESVEFEITAQEVKEDGNRVSLDTIQTVVRVPTGSSGTLSTGREKKYFRQKVELIKVGGAWKVEMITEKALR